MWCSNCRATQGEHVMSVLGLVPWVCGPGGGGFRREAGVDYRDHYIKPGCGAVNCGELDKGERCMWYRGTSQLNQIRGSILRLLKPGVMELDKGAYRALNMGTWLEAYMRTMLATEGAENTITRVANKLAKQRTEDLDVEPIRFGDD